MSPLTRRLLVIGADAAGMSAASQARRRQSPDRLEIVAFDRGNFASYSACGIPFYVGGQVDDLESLVVRTPDVFRDKYSIQVHLGHEAVEVDLDKGAVLVDDRVNARRRWEGFDDLMVATGATPVRPSLPGVDSAGVFGVQTLDDGVALRSYVRAQKPTRAVIVGGGYIGLGVS